MTATGETRLLGRSPERRDSALLPDDEREVREALAFRKGIVALDIVFDASGNPFVLEIQGLGSGIDGIKQSLAGDMRVPDAVKQFALLYKQQGFEYQNPNWFEEVASDKSEQMQFIPEKHRPQSVVNENFDHLFDNGKVILKPLNAAQGIGIRIFDSAHKEEARAYALELQKSWGSFMAQSFIESSGAELAPDHLKGHAASLRLLLPFEVINGRPVITLHGVGYQRVAPEAMPQDQNGDDGYNRAGVINRCRGAHSVPMSESEYQRALPVAQAVLQNLVTHGDKSWAYQEELIRKLEQKTVEARGDIVWKAGWKPLVNVQTSRFATLDEARNANRFVHFVKRELSLLSEETLLKLEERSVFVVITHTSELNGTIRVNYFKRGKIDVTLNFSTQDSPGVLAAMLEDAARGGKPQEQRGTRSGRRSLDTESERVELPLDMGVPAVY